MKLFKTLAKALNAGFKFEEKGNVEWRLVVGVARQYGWVGEDKEALGVFKMLDLLDTGHRVRRVKLLAQVRPEQQSAEGEGWWIRERLKTRKAMNIFFYIRVQLPLFPKMRGSGLGPIFLPRSTARVFCFGSIP